MSDTEAVMWAVEKDPALRSDFCNLTILDHAPDEKRLRATVDRALVAIPRLAQRVVAAPGSIHRAHAGLTTRSGAEACAAAADPAIAGTGSHCPALRGGYSSFFRVGGVTGLCAGGTV